MRSDSPDALTEQGWAALRAHGVRTIVDLRDAPERKELPPLAELAALHVPVLDFADAEFFESWHRVSDTPGFYRAVLEHWRGRFTDAVVAVARARPGGVLVHCQVGRDRTGLVTAMLLSLAGVDPEDIAADYALSAERLRPLYERLAQDLADDAARERLHRENASEAQWMLDLLADLDIEAYLTAGGATAADLQAARARLLGGKTQRQG